MTNLCCLPIAVIHQILRAWLGLLDWARFDFANICDSHTGNYLTRLYQLPSFTLNRPLDHDISDTVAEKLYMWMIIKRIIKMKTADRRFLLACAKLDDGTAAQQSKNIINDLLSSVGINLSGPISETAQMI